MGIAVAVLALFWLWSRRAGAAPGGGASIPGVPTPGGGQKPDVVRPGSLSPDVDLGGLDAGDAPKNPAAPKAVDAWIADTPTLGRFYQVKSGDTGSSVAKAALGGPQGAGSYIAAWNLNPWNAALYATPFDPNNSNWPAYTSADGTVVGKAFLKRHQNARVRLLSGQAVQRNIKDTMKGSRISGAHSSYGLLWLPSEQNPSPPPFIMEIAGL